MFASATPRCTHLDEIRDVTPSTQGCEECGAAVRPPDVLGVRIRKPGR